MYMYNVSWAKFWTADWEVHACIAYKPVIHSWGISNYVRPILYFLCLSTQQKNRPLFITAINHGTLTHSIRVHLSLHKGQPSIQEWQNSVISALTWSQAVHVHLISATTTINMYWRADKFGSCGGLTSGQTVASKGAQGLVVYRYNGWVPLCHWCRIRIGTAQDSPLTSNRVKFVEGIGGWQAIIATKVVNSVTNGNTGKTPHWPRVLASSLYWWPFCQSHGKHINVCCSWVRSVSPKQLASPKRVQVASIDEEFVTNCSPASIAHRLWLMEASVVHIGSHVEVVFLEKEQQQSLSPNHTAQWLLQMLAGWLCNKSNTYPPAICSVR